MQKARVRIDGLAALVFWEEEGGFSKTVVDAPGLPYVTDKEPLTPLFVEEGYGVVQAQYIGTFDSEGKLTPEGSIETLFKFEQILERNAELYNLREEKRFKIGRQIDVLTGHSFGTYAAIGALLRGLHARVSILFSPMFEFGAKRDEAGLVVDLEKHVRHISEAAPLTLRLQSTELWRQFFLTQEEFHPAPAQAKCSQKTKLLCVIGEHDTSIDVKTSISYVKKFVDSYANCLELVDYIVVPDAKHELDSLLTPDVKKAIRAVIQS